MVWPVSLVELRVCFSWGSGFREFSSWANRDGWLEPQLKQMPCLAGRGGASWAGVGKTNTGLNLAGSGQVGRAQPGLSHREGVAKRGG